MRSRIYCTFYQKVIRSEAILAKRVAKFFPHSSADFFHILREVHEGRLFARISVRVVVASSASFSSSGAQCSSVWIAGLDFRRRCWLLGFTAKPPAPDAAAAAASGSLDGDLRGRSILISTNQLHSRLPWVRPISPISHYRSQPKIGLVVMVRLTQS